MFERKRVAPVREGDEIDVRIEAVGEKGDGIAKTQGFVLFIPGTRSGDEVRVRVTKVLKSAGFAEVIGKSEGVPAQAPRRQPARAEVDKTQEEKKELEELEKASAQDSEDFGEEPAEAEEAAEKAEDPVAEEEPKKE